MEDDDLRYIPEEWRCLTEDSPGIKLIPVDRLIPYENNARTHGTELEFLKNNIRTLGFRTPIEVDAEMVIICGHGRRLAAMELGMGVVPVTVHADLTEDEVCARRLADNEVSDLSGYDFELKDLELRKLEDLGWDMESLGFTKLDLSTDLMNIRPDDDIGEGIVIDTEQDDTPRGYLEVGAEGMEYGEDEEDEIGYETEPVMPEPVKETIIKEGDVIRLGRHVLRCGDSCDPDAVALIADGDVDMVLTDPPYGIDYADKVEHINRDGWDRKVEPIIGDDMDECKPFFRAWLDAAVPALKPINTVYIFLSGKHLHELRLAFDEAGYHWSDYLIWVKNCHSLSRGDYKNRYETIMYGYMGQHHFYGDFSTNVLEFPRTVKNDLHPTMKPVDLLCKLIRDGCPPGGTVLDLFGGSGSTLIACERTGRSCRMQELNPIYCDTIVRRYAMETETQDITIERDGESIPFPLD